MSARIDSSGRAFQLDRQTEPDEQVSEADVAEPESLTRILMRILKDVTTLKRRWWPRRIDFEDRAVSTAGASLSLTHDFGGRVRWHLVDWESSGTSAPILKRDAATDNNTLVLLSYVAGTATIRVEEAG